MNQGSFLIQMLTHPWISWVGFRYLHSKKSSRFLSFITFLSISGVCLGVATLIVVLSVMDGFEVELKKRLTSSDVHVLIESKSHSLLDETLINIDSLKKENPEIKSVWPTLSSEAILKMGRKITGVLLKSLNETRFEHFKTQLVEQADERLLISRKSNQAVSLPEIYLGQELAFEMGVIPGDQLTLVSPTEAEGPFSSIPRLQRFVVAGVYHFGSADEELHTVFAKKPDVESFLKQAGVVTQWELLLEDYEKAPALAQKIRFEQPDLEIKDWMDMNSSLFFSLKLERIAMFIILAFIVVVASFNIVTTLSMMVMEKRKEIAILKAMGARKSQIGALFLTEGLWIGFMGLFFGMIGAYSICVFLKKYQWLQLPDVYYDRTLPVTFDPLYYWLVGVSVLAIVIFACRYPSQRAARLSPLDGLRQ